MCFALGQYTMFEDADLRQFLMIVKPTRCLPSVIFLLDPLTQAAKNIPSSVSSNTARSIHIDMKNWAIE